MNTLGRGPPPLTAESQASLQSRAEEPAGLPAGLPAVVPATPARRAPVRCRETLRGGPLGVSKSCWQVAAGPLVTVTAGSRSGPASTTGGALPWAARPDAQGAAHQTQSEEPLPSLCAPPRVPSGERNHTVIGNRQTLMKRMNCNRVW